MNHYFNITGKRKGEPSSTKPISSPLPVEFSNKPISNSLPVETTIPKRAADAQFIASSGQPRRSMRGQEMISQPITFQEAQYSSKRVMDQDSENYTKRNKEPKLHNYDDEHKLTSQRRYTNLHHLDNFDNSKKLNVELNSEKEIARLMKENSKQSQRISTLEERLAQTLDHLKELANLRETEPEALLNKLAASSKAKDEAYAKLEQSIKRIELSRPMLGNRGELVQQLQQKNQELEAQNRGLEAQAQELKAQNRELKAQKDSSEDSDIYKALTSLSVKSVKKQDNGNLYMCEVICSAGTHKFFLFIPDQQDKKVVYTPIMDQPRNPLIESALPDFLRDEIVFDKLDLPLFFGRMESSLHAKA